MAGDEKETSREDIREGRWLSYDELGQIRGIGRASAVKLAQREKWQRRPGNDRTARVLVPLEWLKPARRQSEVFREESQEVFPEFLRIVSVLEAAIATSKERAEADAATISTLREQLERADAQAEAERNRADRAEQGRDGERTRADALRDRLDVLQAQLATVEAEGAESDVATAELTAQLKEARRHAEEVQQAAETRRETEAAARRSLGLVARARAAWRGE